MKPILVILPLASFLPLSSPAQPTVSRLQNNYSYVLPGLPNYGIAQGSIFDIFGTGLASSTSGLQSAPLSDNLNGVTVTVTVGTVTTHPLLYYVSPTQIAAILPSTTPVGTGQITVSADGQTSKVAPIQVVRSAFGILTKDGTGGGGAAATDLNGQSLNSANSANSGDYITLWGSGLGPAAGNDALTPVPADLAAIPVEVEIG